MKHPSSREMFSYWTALRGPRQAPTRDEIDPAALRRILADSFVLSFNPPAGHSVTLAGTRVCALFCREIKSLPFLNLWDAESRPLLSSLLGFAAEEATAVVAGAVGRTRAEPTVPLEMLLLPLAPHGSLHRQVIGALAPLAPASWIGMTPLETLTAGAFRLLPPDAPESRELVPARRGARLTTRLVVYEGGAAGGTSIVEPPPPGA